jgi:hypothetical protein
VPCAIAGALGCQVPPCALAPPCASRHKAGTRPGRASLGPRRRRIDGQRVADRRHRRPVRRRAGREPSRPDHRDVSQLDGHGPDSRRDPTELFAAILAAAPRDGPVRSDRAEDAFRSVRWRTTWRGQARSSPPPRMRLTYVAEWARRHRHGCGVGRLLADAVARHRRLPAAQSAPSATNGAHTGEPVVSTATAESTWRTPSPPAVPVAFPAGSGQAVRRQRLPTQRERRPRRRVRAGPGAVTLRRQNTATAGRGDAARGAGRRATRTRQQRRDDLPGQ